MEEEIGLLVMAYGTPASLDEVRPYYTHIRRGSPPSPEQLQDLLRRYEAIGGCSPLNDITMAQARLLHERLQALRDAGAPVPRLRLFVGMKHCRPFIANAVQQIADAGLKQFVGVVLAPHYASMSVAVYQREAREAAQRTGLAAHLVDAWHTEPAFIEGLVRRVKKARRALQDANGQRMMVLFTAHSLPERIVAAGDPYPQQLLETAESVACGAGVETWQFAWQSAGRTAEKWLGPDILDVLRDLASQGYDAVLVCPVGFVSDHLEVLYDVDIEAQAVARECGLRLARTESFNTDDALVEALASAVQKQLASVGSAASRGQQA
ncbi:MAG: ferrochelatase [Firmicutes bacterium]|nr:ferrochelatase [Bacillota bacterium]